MKHAKTRALYQYWNAIRGDRPAPRRLEIEPGAIAPLLPNVFILQRLDDATYRFRLAGTHICAYFGTELRDRKFTSLWPFDEREAIESLLCSIGEDAAGAVAGLEGRERSGRVASFELLLLPLTTKTDRFDRMIGLLAPIEAPYWLGNWPLLSFRLKSVRILWPDRRPPLFDRPHSADPAGRHAAQARSGLTVIDGGLTETG